MENKDNPAAFARPWSKIKQNPDAPEQISMAQAGMTLRDYFAAKALQSYMINCKAMHVNDGYIAETELGDLAKYSYQIADAMLGARKTLS